jgi:hypothetical protein
MKSAAATICGALVFLVAAADGAAAQDSFSDLQTQLSPGTVVIVEDAAGNRSTGILKSVDTSIRLVVNGAEREWSPSQVRQIRRRGDSVRNGLTIGLLSGAAAGTVFGLALASWASNEGHDAAGPFIAMLALGTGAGAGIGAGLDAAITGSTVVYRREKNRVSIGSMVGPQTRGVGLQVSF